MKKRERIEWTDRTVIRQNRFTFTCFSHSHRLVSTTGGNPLYLPTCRQRRRKFAFLVAEKLKKYIQEKLSWVTFLLILQMYLFFFFIDYSPNILTTKTATVYQSLTFFILNLHIFTVSL